MMMIMMMISLLCFFSVYYILNFASFLTAYLSACIYFLNNNVGANDDVDYVENRYDDDKNEDDDKIMLLCHLFVLCMP